MKRVRLVKIETRATFVVDDGKTLTELEPATGVFSASEWPDAIQKLEEARLNVENQINTPERLDSSIDTEN